MVAPRITVPSTFDSLDEAIDDAWDAVRSLPGADRVFYSASESANFSMVWHTLGVVTAIARRDPTVAIRNSAALAAEAALVNGPIKSVFERERPHVEARPMKLRKPKTSSFPSGHASAATVAAGMLGPHLATPFRVGLRVFAGIVATSRIHVRIHHATDVAAGAATGWILLRLLRPLLRRLV